MSQESSVKIQKMSVHLQRDLEGLKKRLLTIGALVEEAAWKATTALLDRKAWMAKEVIAGDSEVDRQEVEMEEDCLKVLALHQPVAKDLRFVAAVLKINNDLERVGDLAVNIAKRAVFLAERDPAPIPSSLKPMSEAARKMLRQSLDAFVREDAEGAHAVRQADEQVDRFNKEIRLRAEELMREDPNMVDRAVCIISAARNLERVADHATNVAEDVIYMVEGAIVRHPGNPATPNPPARKVT